MNRLRSAATAPVDAASLVWFRIAFGALMAFECTRYLAFGWVHDYWIGPSFHFKYLGFEWVNPWPGEGMVVHFVVLIVAASAVAIGAFYRLAIVTFTLGFSYVFLLDQAQYLNHFYAVMLFAGLLALMPAHVDGSVDARRRPELQSAVVPAWTIWALRAQMGFIYAWGGIAKLNGDWLTGQPLTMWLRASEYLPGWIKGDAGLYLSWGGAMFDLLIVPLLLWPRTRTTAVILAIVFHLGNAWMFHIGIFPWVSIAATLLFLRPDHPLFVRTIARVRVPVGSRRIEASPVVAGLLALWVVSQLLLPLRPFLYDSHVHWSEEGHRFSWHMKLRSKESTGHFWVQPRGEERRRVDPRDDLTKRQMSKMLGRPDMILQYAHHLAQRHGEGARVYAQVFCALNGRKPALLVDDEVDLAAEPRTLGHASWIVPFEAEER